MIQKQEILKAVCNYYTITVSDLFNREKTKDRMLKRQIFTYLLLTDSVGTLDQHVKFIFEASEQRFTHPTLIYSRDKINANRKHYKHIAKAIDEIRQLYPKKDFNYLEFQNCTIPGLNYSYQSATQNHL
jgi:chromosomal replication initiation ATPase DnaA